MSCAPLLLSFYENYGFKRFATFSFIRAVHCGLPFVMQNGGNLWQIIKQRNKKYRNLQTTFKGMEKSVDRESERKFWECHMAARIDHRSYKEQRIDLIPTIHEGYEVRAMAKGELKQ